MLEVTNLDVQYGKLRALHNLSARIEDNECVVVLGRNGAGKSTLLMAISGLIPIASGALVWYGERIDGKPAHAIVSKGISHVPQGRELFPDMTVEENLGLGAWDRPSGNRLAERLDRIYGEFPLLAERRKQRAGTLSGGEQQMVAIARALMAEPRLLLLDEPSTGLAPVMVNQVADVLLSLRKTGLTLLLVEQNTHLGLELADRAYILEQGEVVASGDSQQLRADPALTRAYIGL